MASTPCTPQGEATNQMVATISTSSQLTKQVRMEDLNTSPTNLWHILLTTSPAAMPPMDTAVEAEATLSLPTNQMVTTIYPSSKPGQIPSLASTPCTPQGEAASQMVAAISTSSQPDLLPDLRETGTPITTLPHGDSCGG
jgi:hypothetical protein